MEKRMWANFITRFKTLFRDWIPVALVCGSVIGSVSGGTLWFAQDRSRMFDRLGQIEDSQKTMRATQQVIVENQWEMVNTLDKVSINQQRVLETLKIPSVTMPHHGPNPMSFPPAEGAIGKRKHEPLFKEQSQPEIYVQDKHSLFSYPEPMYATQQVPQDAQIPKIRSTQ